MIIKLQTGLKIALFSKLMYLMLIYLQKSCIDTLFLL